MSDISAVRAGLKTNLATISGLAVQDFVAGVLNPPVAVVGFPTEIDYTEAMNRGMDEVFIPVRVYVSSQINEAATRALEDYLNRSGATSVKAAIESDKTLGGACRDLFVTAMSGCGPYEWGGVVYLAADWDVRILLS